MVLVLSYLGPSDLGFSRLHTASISIRIYYSHAYIHTTVLVEIEVMICVYAYVLL